MTNSEDNPIFQCNNLLLQLEWIIGMVIIFGIICIWMQNIFIYIICGVLYLKPGLTMFKRIYFFNEKIIIYKPFNIGVPIKKKIEYSYDELLRIEYYPKVARSFARDKIEIYFINDSNVFTSLYRKLFYSFHIHENDRIIEFINEMKSRGVKVVIND